MSDFVSALSVFALGFSAGITAFEWIEKRKGKPGPSQEHEVGAAIIAQAESLRSDIKFVGDGWRASRKVKLTKDGEIDIHLILSTEELAA